MENPRQPEWVMNGGFLNEINESAHSLAAEGNAAAARTGKEGQKQKLSQNA
jgi:hypothetical protein